MDKTTNNFSINDKFSNKSKPYFVASKFKLLSVIYGTWFIISVIAVSLRPFKYASYFTDLPQYLRNIPSFVLSIIFLDLFIPVIILVIVFALYILSFVIRRGGGGRADKNSPPFILFFIFIITIPCYHSVTYSQTEDNGAKTTINGFIDIYFSKNFASPANALNKYRNFDVNENQFSISLAKLTVQKQASPIGFKLDFAFGPTADIIHSAEPHKSLYFLQQALITVVLPIGKGLTVNAGKMATHMGAEVIESISNPNYSRSLLFAYAVPYYHIGICATYPVLDNLSITGYIYNGWNIMQDNNKYKTLGATLSWTPVSNLTIIENWIGGVEQPDSISTNARHVFDTIINYTLSDRISFSLNADYGFEKQLNGDMAIWKGVVVIGKYVLSETSSLSLRGEVYSDPYGFTTGTIQDLKEITFTYEKKFLKNLLVRFEYRSDWSNVNVFDDHKNIGSRTDQNTFLISSVVSL